MNSAISYGINIIFHFEEIGHGLNWSNWTKSAPNDNNLSIATIMLLMLITSIIHFIMALWIEQENFNIKSASPFRMLFWFESSEESNNLCDDNISYKHEESNFEEDPTNLRAGIVINNLRKVYGDKIVAVNGLTMKMYENQITVLLGQNGSGKTSTMSMLSGILKASSGTALINGFDIQSDLKHAQNSIGICPQHNILFDDLTVKEHIELFCHLKGLHSEDVKEEKEKFINLLKLKSKENELSKTLSGGMKRKLSIALALCGKSKVVLCDEPTSGMDPLARRELWDLLQTEKQNRTIVLSTHFMDEADALGDRIAILSNGELHCSGTTYFLKKNFGCGYNLICVKQNNCISQNVTQLLNKFIPNIQIHAESEQEISYKLPREADEKFESMLNELEINKNNLCLNSFGISLTTLDDVFVNINKETKDDNLSDDIYEMKLKLENGLTLMKNQFYSMFKKRYILWKRSWFLFIFQNLLAVIFVVVSVTVARNEKNENYSYSPLLLNLNIYGKSISLIEIADNPTDMTKK